MRRPRRRSERGSVLFFTMAVLLLLSTVGSTALLRGVHEHSLGRRSMDRHSAFYMAEAGVDQVITNLAVNNTANVPSTSVLTAGSFSATVTTLTATRFQAVVTGQVGHESRMLDVVMERTGHSVFRYPLFGKDSVLFKKTGLTDSYDSRLGIYDAATAGSEGNIATNGIVAGSIELRSGTAINGQVIVGPGLANPSDAVDDESGVIITGTPPVVSAPSALDLPGVTPPVAGCNADANDLSLPKDATYTFTEASSPYCFDDITADKNSVIRVTGDVVVYANNVDFDKNLNVNVGGKPTQFLLKIMSSEDVVFDKDGTFVGAIYAPNSHLEFKKDLDFYGAMAGKSIRINKDGQFHYDEALADAPNAPAGSYDVSIISWREQ